MLLFRSNFVAPIVRGEKTVTRRTNVTWRFKVFKPGVVHQAYVTPPWADGKPFARLAIVSVTESTFDIDDAEVRREGFVDRAAFMAYVEQHAVDLSQPVARIEFKLVTFNSRVAMGFIKRGGIETSRRAP